MPRWSVDVVFRAAGHQALEDEVVAGVNERLRLGPDRAARPAYSFDISPPDGSIGVSCWMEATGPGEAADDLVSLVKDAIRAVAGIEGDLWDIRVVPESAVLTREEFEAQQSASRKRLRGRGQ